MLNNDETTNKDLKSEIEKNRKVLDSVYIDTENLKKDRTSLTDEILRLTKHKNYLDAEVLARENEYNTKVEAIKGLDEQITDKSKERDDLESSVNSLKTELISETDKINKAKEELELLDKVHAEKSESMDIRHKELDSREQKVESREIRIKKFVEELK